MIWSHLFYLLLAPAATLVFNEHIKSKLASKPFNSNISSQEAKYVQSLFIIYCYIFIISNLWANVVFFFSFFHIVPPLYLSLFFFRNWKKSEWTKHRKNLFFACCLITILPEHGVERERMKNLILNNTIIKICHNIFTLWASHLNILLQQGELLPMCVWKHCTWSREENQITNVTFSDNGDTICKSQ